jgi:DNA-binding LacI/PurR family transcriptional regulator
MATTTRTNGPVTLRVLRHAGLRVPGNMAVVGRDGIDFGRYTTPELSTVEHPRAELGRLAVEALFTLLDSRTPDEPDVVQPVRVLVRESCGEAAAQA